MRFCQQTQGVDGRTGQRDGRGEGKDTVTYFRGGHNPFNLYSVVYLNGKILLSLPWGVRERARRVVGQQRIQDGIVLMPTTLRPGTGLDFPTPVPASYTPQESERGREPFGIQQTSCGKAAIWASQVSHSAIAAFRSSTIKSWYKQRTAKLFVASSCLVYGIARANPPGFASSTVPPLWLVLEEVPAAVRNNSIRQTQFVAGMRVSTGNGCAPGNNETIPQPVYNRLQKYILKAQMVQEQRNMTSKSCYPSPE